VDAYEESLKGYRDFKNSMDTAGDDGEKKKAIEVARKMLQKHYPIAEIIDLTGLSEEEINKLR
jgi:hypothetical protein